MRFFVYILFSEKLSKFYIGYSSNIDQRIAYHNNKEHNSIWTKNGIPWKLFFQLSCESERQAINIEKHIKKMKSKSYIQNLVKYPGLTEKLLSKFKP